MIRHIKNRLKLPFLFSLFYYAYSFSYYLHCPCTIGFVQIDLLRTSPKNTILLMNKLFYSFWSLMLMGAMVLTTACGQEEDVTPEAPAITLSGVTDPTTATANVGQAVSFKVNIAAPGGFNVIRVDRTIGTGSTVTHAEQAKTPGQTVTSYAYDFSFTPTADMAGKAVTFDFVATDDNSKQATHTFVVNVNEPAILSYTAVLLGGQSNPDKGSFYNAIDNTVYLMAAAKNNKAKVDMLYYFGATNKATISAPNSTDAKAVFGATDLEGMTNATEFVRTTAVFENITKASEITSAWAEKKTGTIGAQVTDLSVGHTFAFQLAQGRGFRIGVAKVEKIEGTTDGTRSITLSVKLQSTNN